LFLSLYEHPQSRYSGSVKVVPGGKKASFKKSSKFQGPSSSRKASDQYSVSEKLFLLQTSANQCKPLQIT
jgi:hypothetical protein